MAWLAVCLLAFQAGAQTSFERREITNELWTAPFPAHRVVGDVYYVGTYDLAAFLITTPEGHILINTGAYDSADMIRTSTESLGFDFDDIEILLTTQAHWDHVADLAEIKRRTGARLFAHEGDVPVLEDGGNSDFRFPQGRGAIFEPVSVDRTLQHGDTIELGGTVLTLHHHPGHTRGASSFTFDTEDNGRTYSVLVVNMGSINNGVELLNMPAYPEIAEDYAATFAAQKTLSADVWVSSHGRHYNLYDKFSPGDAYDPERFIDPDGYQAKIDEYEQLYLTQLEAERAQRAQ
ncbi:MAG: subclass B3 metallo-beta-lactamase [Gammaproteobacteria bacterium]|nr:subclass B3 metallo-beta-lactamase [Gammaproteobacteria bacterium]